MNTTLVLTILNIRGKDYLRLGTTILHIQSFSLLEVPPIVRLLLETFDAYILQEENKNITLISHAEHTTIFISVKSSLHSHHRPSTYFFIYHMAEGTNH